MNGLVRNLFDLLSPTNIYYLKSFSQIGVHDDFIKAMNELGIEIPTQIQEEAIPFLLSKDEDFIGQAQTGSGKTAAFVLPLLHKVDHTKGEIQALILSPTRELCKQIAKQIFRLTKYSIKIYAESVYGGEKIDIQIQALKRPTQIVVATPGRLIDLLHQKALTLDHIEYVILDEADEMLSMGFREELNKILDATPKEKSVWLFSATMPQGIKQIVSKYLSTDAKKVTVDIDQRINERIEHQYLICEHASRMKHLINFIKFQGDKRAIIFCKTKMTANKVCENLLEKKYKAGAIHGDLQQRERDKVMRAFRNEKVQLLIATDISARGIDVKDLAYVVHYELPDKIEYYTHRSGRTARAGKKGISLAFISSSEIRDLRHVESKLRIKFRNIG
ncbi:MAG: ATP-dependent RNA helicase DeaD [Patiriisocius sp.]